MTKIKFNLLGKENQQPSPSARWLFVKLNDVLTLQQ